MRRSRARIFPSLPLDFSTPRRRQGCDEQGILFKRMHDLESCDHVESLSRARCVGCNGLQGQGLKHRKFNCIIEQARGATRRTESRIELLVVSVSEEDAATRRATDRARARSSVAIRRRKSAASDGGLRSRSINPQRDNKSLRITSLIDPAFVKYSTAAAIKRKLPSALSTLRDTQLGSTLHSAKQKLRRVFPSVDYLPEYALFTSSLCLPASAKAANSLQEAIFHEAFTGSQRTITCAGSACKTGPSFF